MAFRFKHFKVDDDRSTMQVGTDAMLLGSWIDPGKATAILDLGTGCGVLALMAAQRSSAMILAIDIDKESVVQATENFDRSPWASRLTAQCISAADLAVQKPGEFDLVISNPPYFSRSLRSPHRRKNLARHDEGLNHEQLLSSAARLLSDRGEFAVILPFGDFPDFAETAVTQGFSEHESCAVRSFGHKEPVRMLARFSKSVHKSTAKRELIIFEAPGKFTGEYLEITEAYHHF